MKLRKGDGPQVDVDYRKVTSLKMSASSGFETTRNVVLSGFAGMAIANVALGVASMAFPPLAAFNLVVVGCSAIYGGAEGQTTWGRTSQR